MPQPLAAQTVERRFYPDLLRVISCLGVILVHTAGQNWNSGNIRSAGWLVFTFYDGAMRWSVITFAMISGALLLGRETPISRILTRYLPRIAGAFLVWSLLYGLMEASYGMGRKDVLRLILLGPKHFWYLYMLAGMYLLLPVLQQLAKHPRLAGYYCLLALIFAFLIPQALSLLALFRPGLADLLSRMVGKLDLGFVMGFPAYFLLGYFLDRTNLSRRQYRLLWAGGVLGFLVSTLGTVLVSRRLGAPSELLWNTHAPNILLQAMLVFVLVKRRFDRSDLRPGLCRCFARLSQYSFGAFLCHAHLLVILSRSLHFNTLFLPAPVSVPLVFCAVTVLAFGISALLNRIPVVNRYFV